MFNLTILEIIIGLVYLYLIFKLLVSFANVPSTLFKFLVIHLKSAIQNMLNKDDSEGKKLSMEFYDYPIIQSFVKKKDKGIPMYFEPKKFAKIVVDIYEKS